MKIELRIELRNSTDHETQIPYSNSENVMERRIINFRIGRNNKADFGLFSRELISQILVSVIMRTAS